MEGYSISHECGVSSFLEISASSDWKVVYNVSAGMDTDSDKCQQTWNPFNGNIIAPASWFSLGITDGIHGAYSAERNAVCIFVFEYGFEYGMQLEKIALEMGIRCLFLHALLPDEISIAGIANGCKTCLTAITFPRPAGSYGESLSSTTGSQPICCEMHGLLHYAFCSKEPFLQPLLHSRVCASGHMDIRSLLAKDPFGEWDPLVKKWLNGDFLRFLRTSNQKRRSLKIK